MSSETDARPPLTDNASRAEPNTRREFFGIAAMLGLGSIVTGAAGSTEQTPRSEAIPPELMPTKPLQHHVDDLRKIPRDGGLDMYLSLAMVGANGVTVAYKTYTRRVETPEGFSMTHTLHQERFRAGVPRTGTPEYAAQKTLTVTGRRGSTVNADGIRYDEMTCVEVLKDGTTLTTGPLTVPMNTTLAASTAGMSFEELLDYISQNCQCH